MAAVPRVVEILRALARRDHVDVPVLIGFRGAKVPVGRELRLTDGTVRGIRPVERHLLMSEHDTITAVLETTFPLQLLGITAGTNSGGVSAYFESIQRCRGRIEDDYRSLQRRVDRVRLSVLLTSEGDQYLATSEVSRYLVDPTKPGGQTSWGGATPEGPGSYDIPGERLEEIFRTHQLLSEKHPDSLNVAMRRVLQAVSERLDPTDAFIDAVVVWENCFGVTPETTFRVTAAIAKLLEPTDPNQRRVLQKELSKLYSDRSKVVHGAQDQKSEVAWASRQRAIAIALDTLRALYHARPDLLEVDSKERGLRLLLDD